MKNGNAITTVILYAHVSIILILFSDNKIPNITQTIINANILDSAYAINLSNNLGSSCIMNSVI